MPASISTSSLARITATAITAALLALASPHAFAADAPNGGAGNTTPPSGDRTNKPEEDDFTQTPYTEYGSFNEEKDEEEDTKFENGNKSAGTRARKALMEIKKACDARRKEIQAAKNEG